MHEQQSTHADVRLQLFEVFHPPFAERRDEILAKLPIDLIL